MSGEGVAIIAPDPAGEVAHAEARVEEAQAHAEAAVQIAETEAVASVQREEIRAETEQAAIAAAAEVATSVTREEMATCQANLSNLSERMDQQVSLTQSILSRVEKLEPPLPNPPVASGDSGQMPESQEAPEPPKKKRSALKWT